ncbi:sulfatase-like hydrolase/transferase [Actinomadura sp. WMMB 499]|uniref:sulfatase-like hydrolase/transferase n=1 Tax=Actinomadura sp. WMMB 499 TaxID=1219491 RepID=UPI0020C8280A|nr:sulfatase-like hydrolase/transferase [Actinomadura sp. WMMB 499]
MDDTGFAQLGCFGSDIATPNMDRLAASGLRYNRFHVTALCSPSRASFLTGRNHHAVGLGFLADIPLEHHGYTARLGRPRRLTPWGRTPPVGRCVQRPADVSGLRHGHHGRARQARTSGRSVPALR